MKNLKLTAAILSLALFGACSSDDSSKDTIKPTIDLTVSGGFPTSCATVQRGGNFPFKAVFSDNEQLGSYSIGIHSNFDHHSHDTEIDACPLDPVKTAVNDWREIFTFEVPGNVSQFTASHNIDIPSDIDTGDYHVEIKVTDANGWSTMKGISIKVVE